MWTSGSSELEFAPETDAGASTTVQIPAGAMRYFQVVGDITLTGAGTTYSVTTQLLGDSAHISASGNMGVVSSIYSSESQNDFFWSPNATTTSSRTHVDWTNGYGVPGLPSNNLTGQTLAD